MPVSINQIRFTSLISAILIYAIFSSPTPDAPSWIEAIIGALLCCSCAPKAFEILLRPNAPRPHWQNAAIIAILFTITAPLIKGLLSPHTPANIARDIIPTLYLFLPLFACDIFQNSPKRIKTLIASLTIAAISFSLRSLPYDAQSLIVKLIASLTIHNTQELTYFANAPTLLFTAGLSYAIVLHTIPPSQIQNPIKSTATALIALIVVTITLAAMQIPLQRASIAAFAGLALLAHINLTRQNPYKGITLLIVSFLLITTIQTTESPITNLYQNFTEKTRTLGLNMRAEEWLEILNITAETWQKTLLGTGWGGGFNAPSADGDYITYAHGLIAATQLKTGIIGLCIYGFYITTLLHKLLKNTRKAPILTACIAAPLLINITLYGAYKSLDFGLLLLLATTQFFLATDQKKR